MRTRPRVWRPSTRAPPPAGRGRRAGWGPRRAQTRCTFPSRAPTPPVCVPARICPLGIPVSQRAPTRPLGPPLALLPFSSRRAAGAGRKRPGSNGSRQGEQERNDQAHAWSETTRGGLKGGQSSELSTGYKGPEVGSSKSGSSLSRARAGARGPGAPTQKPGAGGGGGQDQQKGSFSGQGEPPRISRAQPARAPGLQPRKL